MEREPRLPAWLAIIGLFVGALAVVSVIVSAVYLALTNVQVLWGD